MGRGRCGEQGSRKERMILIKALRGIQLNIITNLHQKKQFYFISAVPSHSIFLSDTISKWPSAVSKTQWYFMTQNRQDFLGSRSHHGGEWRESYIVICRLYQKNTRKRERQLHSLWIVFALDDRETSSNFLLASLNLPLQYIHYRSANRSLIFSPLFYFPIVSEQGWLHIWSARSEAQLPSWTFSSTVFTHLLSLWPNGASVICFILFCFSGTCHSHSLCTEG